MPGKKAMRMTRNKRTVVVCEAWGAALFAAFGGVSGEAIDLN